MDGDELIQTIEKRNDLIENLYREVERLQDELERERAYSRLLTKEIEKSIERLQKEKGA